MYQITSTPSFLIMTQVVSFSHHFPFIQSKNKTNETNKSTILKIINIDHLAESLNVGNNVIYCFWHILTRKITFFLYPVPYRIYSLCVQILRCPTPRKIKQFVQGIDAKLFLNRLMKKKNTFAYWKVVCPQFQNTYMVNLILLCNPYIVGGKRRGDHTDLHAWTKNCFIFSLPSNDI